jgi:hypothetical protein
MKMWMMRFSSDYQLEIINSIHNSGYNISLLTGNKETLELLSTNKALKKIDFVDNNMISALCVDYPIEQSKYMESMFVRYLCYKYYFAHQLLERNERYSGELSFEERNYIIYKQVEFWSYKIRVNRPSVVVFMDVPHMYYEWVLMAILEKENIPCLIIGSTPANGMVFLDINMHIISGYGGEEFYTTYNNYILTVKKKHEKISDLVTNNSNLNVFITIKMVLSFFVKGWFDVGQRYEIGYYIKSGFYKSGINSALSQRYRLLRYALEIRYLKVVYQFYSSAVTEKDKYVYLPLISGYEATMHPSISPLNIIIILDEVSNIIPDDWFIYVKEHPAQFNLRHDQRFSRSKKLYKIISKIKKVKLIVISHDHHDLILNAEYVLGSSMSSIAYQAIAHKKMIRYFGIDVLPNEFAKPLFSKDNKTEINQHTKCYHNENVQIGTNKDAVLIAKKIIDWCKDQIHK